MTDERTGAERLDDALDARVRGHAGKPASGPDTDSALLATFERLQALDALPPTDSRLMTSLWREMMSAGPARHRAVETPELTGRQPLVIETGGGHLPRHQGRSRRVTGEMVTTIALIALLLTVLLGYQRFNGGDAPDRPAAVTGNQPEIAATPTATVSGCTAQPRIPGTVAALAGTTPATPAYLPRLGNDPVYSEAIGNDDPVDGEALLRNSEPDPAFTPPIAAMLDQLVACRIYAFSNRSGTDLDGRYWALYSDDYFRRELSGYREAGLPLDIGTFWMPSTVPAVIETRVLADGVRVLAILEKPTPRNPNRVVIFVRSGDRWLVDEVGMAHMPSGESRYDVAPEMPVGDIPRLDIGIFDAEPPATPPAAPAPDAERFPSVCDPLTQGTPVPCGTNTQRFGPYLANEFPANTDVTITLYNLGQQAHRFTVPDLGIDLTIAPDDAASFVLNAGDGQYLYLIYEGDDEAPIGAGVFAVITPGDDPDEQPSVG